MELRGRRAASSPREIPSSIQDISRVSRKKARSRVRFPRRFTREIDFPKTNEVYQVAKLCNVMNVISNLRAHAAQIVYKLERIISRRRIFLQNFTSDT